MFTYKGAYNPPRIYRNKTNCDLSRSITICATPTRIPNYPIRPTTITLRSICNIPIYRPTFSKSITICTSNTIIPNKPVSSTTITFRTILYNALWMSLPCSSTICTLPCFFAFKNPISPTTVTLWPIFDGTRFWFYLNNPVFNNFCHTTT